MLIFYTDSLRSEIVFSVWFSLLEVRTCEKIRQFNVSSHKAMNAEPNYFDRTVRKNKIFSSRVPGIVGNVTLQRHVHLKCSTQLHTGEFRTEIVTWPQWAELASLPPKIGIYLYAKSSYIFSPWFCVISWLLWLVIWKDDFNMKRGISGPKITRIYFWSYM